MVSVGILQSDSVIRECNQHRWKNSNNYIKGKNYKKTIGKSGNFRGNPLNRSRAFRKKISRSRGFYSRNKTYLYKLCIHRFGQSNHIS